MDWILEHLQIIIAIAGAIAYWLNARSKDRSGEPADYDGDGKPDVHTDAGRSLREYDDAMNQEENTRRIQEEIRRKIAERQAGGAPTPPPFYPTPHLPYQKMEAPAQDWRREQAEEARREEAAQEAAAVLERQRALAGQLAALNARKAEAEREAKAVWVKQSEPATAAGADLRDDTGLLGELRNARSLRKAIVLREVLGAPVGLR